MTSPNDPHLQKLQFYATTAYPCGYLPGKLAQSLIAAPHHLIDANTYSGLIQQGFRRSGKFAYRPHCEHCNACIPIRLPVEEFTPSRSQRRAYRQHQALEVNIMPLAFKREHFALYSAYQAARHEGKLDDNSESVDQYRNFLVQSNVESLLVEFRLPNATGQAALKIVSVVDMVRDGISAVYTFYTTEDATASYGTFNIVWLVEWARSMGLGYVYLGYWIEKSRKMSYKQKFNPQQALIDGEWVRLDHLNAEP